MIEKDKSWRFQRIEKIIHELAYEVERGLMEGDIESNWIGFQKLMIRSQLNGKMTMLTVQTSDYEKAPWASDNQLTLITS